MKKRFLLLMMSSLLLSPVFLFADAATDESQQDIKTVKLSPKVSPSPDNKTEQTQTIKLSPKVRTVARDFKQVPCDQLSQVFPQSEKENLNLKRRKNQCVNSVNAFMKGR